MTRKVVNEAENQKAAEIIYLFPSLYVPLLDIEPNHTEHLGILSIFWQLYSAINPTEVLSQSYLWLQRAFQLDQWSMMLDSYVDQHNSPWPPTSVCHLCSIWMKEVLSLESGLDRLLASHCLQVILGISAKVQYVKTSTPKTLCKEYHSWGQFSCNSWSHCNRRG